MASVTIRDVAKKAGVGVGTVSRVLNKSTAVSTATRQKVLAAIDDLNYTPSPLARRLSLGRTMTIGVIAPFFIRPSYIERLRGVEASLADSEYDFIIYNVETIERRDTCFRDLPRQERVDGLLLMTLPPTDEEVDRFQEADRPVVLIDSPHNRISHVNMRGCAGRGMRHETGWADQSPRQAGQVHTNPGRQRPSCCTHPVGAIRTGMHARTERHGATRTGE